MHPTDDEDEFDVFNRACFESMREDVAAGINRYAEYERALTNQPVGEASEKPPEKPASITPEVFSQIGGMVLRGSEAITAWLLEAEEGEPRRKRLVQLREYTALAPPEHRELVTRAVARTRTQPIQSEQKNPPKPNEE